MRAPTLLIAVALSLMGQQASDIVVRSSFETDTSGWTAMGQAASVQTTRDVTQTGAQGAFSILVRRLSKHDHHFSARQA